MRELQACDVGQRPEAHVVSDAVPVGILATLKFDKVVLGAQHDVVPTEEDDRTEEHSHEEVLPALMVREEHASARAVHVRQIHVEEAQRIHAHVVQEHARCEVTRVVPVTSFENCPIRATLRVKGRNQSCRHQKHKAYRRHTDCAEQEPQA